MMGYDPLMVSEKLKMLSELLNNKDWYDIIAVIRGPDCIEMTHCKEIFTARIRWLAGLRRGMTRNGPYIDVDLLTLCLSGVREINRMKGFDYHHWSYHTKLALHSLALLNIMKRDEYEFLNNLLNILDDIYIHGYVTEEKLRTFLKRYETYILNLDIDNEILHLKHNIEVVK